MTNPDASRVSMARNLQMLRQEIPALIEYERLQATLKRAKFVALVGEGFTESQALDLCKEWKS